MAGFYLPYKKLKKNNMANKSIHDYPEEQENDDNKAPGFKNLLADLEPVYATIKNNEFVHGIEQYVRAHSIDMLMILPHKHSFVERLFFKTHTAELIEKLQVPIVCITETAIGNRES